MVRIKAWHALVLVLLFTTAGCGQGKEEVTVSAPMSLKDALEETKKGYPAKNVVINLNFGASGVLQHQVEQGAPVDVLITADQERMKDLEGKGLVDPSSRKDFLTNELVLITPKDVKIVENFSDLLKAGVEKIAIGDPGVVPAGKYARQTLHSLNLWDELKHKLVLAKDVRQVLHYVETGSADAGLVYLSDAYSSRKVRVAAIAGKDLHQEIVYSIAILNNSRNQKAASDFVHYLTGAEAASVFAKYGFSPISVQQ